MVASSSFSVGLPRSACAIVSIVSVFITKIPIKIFRSHITNSSNSTKLRRQLITSTGIKQKLWRMKVNHEVNTFQVRKADPVKCGPASASYASPDQSHSLPRRPTPALTNQIRDIDEKIIKIITQNGAET